MKSLTELYADSTNGDTHYFVRGATATHIHYACAMIARLSAADGTRHLAPVDA